MDDEDEFIVSMIGDDDDSVAETGSKPIPCWVVDKQI
jgi:hypothetical protein